MSNKKPLSAAENKARMDKGLAAGKTFYLRGGKKLRDKKAAGDVKSPAAPAASKPDVKVDDKSADKEKAKH